MDKDEIVVIDRNMRFSDEKMERELKERAKEKLERAERVEQARFERETWIEKLLDRWFNGKKKVEQKQAQEKSAEQVIARNKQNSR